MSGSAETTTATIPAMTATLISVDIAVRPLFALDLFKDSLHCADRVRQGLPYRLRQPHPGTHVGGLARYDEAPPWAAPHRVEHREDLVRCEAVRVHYPGRRGRTRRLDLEHGDGPGRVPALRGVNEDEQVTAVKQLVDQVHAADA